jgi:hypothetical protein
VRCNVSYFDLLTFIRRIKILRFRRSGFYLGDGQKSFGKD